MVFFGLVRRRFAGDAADFSIPVGLGDLLPLQILAARDVTL